MISGENPFQARTEQEMKRKITTCDYKSYCENPIWENLTDA